MPVLAIIGAQWGDEGKGKIVDLLAERAGMVVRFAGGTNAGHTVINSWGEFRLHLVPSGIFYPYVSCVIGNGVVVDPSALLDEINQLRGAGVDTRRLFVSERAHLVMPYHILLDGLEEELRGKGALGTTRRGVGPAYADKVARRGIRAGDLLNKAVLLERLRLVIEHKNAVLTKLYGVSPLSLDEIYEQCCHYGEELSSFIREADAMVRESLERGDLIILEGAQGTLLDLDFGTYPYVTSSSPTVGGACTGIGLSPMQVNGILGIFKSYTTRVGEGPMPTELRDETGDSIRERAHEYGTTTGRPRRCGWFDAVAARFSAQINGFTKVALTRLDILDALPSLKICTHYRLDGNIISYFPSSSADLERCEPLYEDLAGWQVPISDVTRFEELPPAARAYVNRVEELIGCPVSLISVGARREKTIAVSPVL